MTDIDILSDVKREVGDNSLKAIRALGEKLRDLHQEVANYEDLIRVKKAEINEMEKNAVPQLMTEIGLKEFTLEDGSFVEIKDVVSGSIPKDNANAALKWLRDNGFADLIKSQIEVLFNKGEEKKAVNILLKLREEYEVQAALTSGVHAQTLCAWAREQLSQGKEIPLELLGIWVGRRAKMKLAKGEANG